MTLWHIFGLRFDLRNTQRSAAFGSLADGRACSFGDTANGLVCTEAVIRSWAHCAQVAAMARFGETFASLTLEEVTSRQDCSRPIAEHATERRIVLIRGLRGELTPHAQTLQCGRTLLCSTYLGVALNRAY